MMNYNYADIQPVQQQPYGLLGGTRPAGIPGGSQGRGGGFLPMSSGAPPAQDQSQGLLGGLLGGLPGMMLLKGLLGGQAQPNAASRQAPNPFTQGLFGSGANATWDPQAQSVDQLRGALNAPADSSGWLSQLTGLFGGG